MRGPSLQRRKASRKRSRAFRKDQDRPAAQQPFDTGIDEREAVVVRNVARGANDTAKNRVIEVLALHDAVRLGHEANEGDGVEACRVIRHHEKPRLEQGRRALTAEARNPQGLHHPQVSAKGSLEEPLDAALCPVGVPCKEPDGGRASGRDRDGPDPKGAVRRGDECESACPGQQSTRGFPLAIHLAPSFHATTFQRACGPSQPSYTSPSALRCAPPGAPARTGEQEAIGRESGSPVECRAVDRLNHWGPVASRLGLLIVFLLSATPPALAGPATAGPSLEDVMRLLAASGGVRASYHEQKHLSLLSKPLESEGKLYFQPPDRLARHVEKPGRSWLAVRNDQVVMRDATGEERFDLGRSEVAQGLVDNLAVVLRGDLVLLNARYEVAFQALEAGWRIDLKPRSRMLRSLIASMTIDGVGSEIRRVEVREESGDWTVTEFSGIQTGVRFTPEESGEIFLLTPTPLATHD